MEITNIQRASQMPVIVRREVAQTEIKTAEIAALIFTGFLISWSSFEAGGRIASQIYEESASMGNQYCDASFIPCATAFLGRALSYPLKFGYEKVGSFGLAVSLYLVPAMITAKKLQAASPAQNPVSVN